MEEYHDFEGYPSELPKPPEFNETIIYITEPDVQIEIPPENEKFASRKRKNLRSNKTDIIEGDIALVRSQVNVTRGQAVKAIRECDGDIVNAILFLS